MQATSRAGRVSRGRFPSRLRPRPLVARDDAGAFPQAKVACFVLKRIIIIIIFILLSSCRRGREIGVTRTLRRALPLALLHSCYMYNSALSLVD